MNRKYLKADGDTNILLKQDRNAFVFMQLLAVKLALYSLSTVCFSYSFDFQYAFLKNTESVKLLVIRLLHNNTQMS